MNSQASSAIGRWLHASVAATFLLLCPSAAIAQNAVVEESTTSTECYSSTHAVSHYHEKITILNERGASLADFVCRCSKNDKLTSFSGLVTDATGRVLRKLKQGDLSRTEYSPYLAIDDYKMYLEYTPPSYPITVTYDWTIDSRDNLIEFPPFCPLSAYDVSLRSASYRLTAPKEMGVRFTTRNIGTTVSTSDDGKGQLSFNLQLSDLPPLKRERYSRPLAERLPVAYFAPTQFSYYGTQGSLNNWNDFGLWTYSLTEGRDQLPDELKVQLHQLTDTMSTARQKVAALYHQLEQSTRYVAILLGIGGQQPATAAAVSKSGFGDCKGLSNYMRAMLQEVGIDAHYTTISTDRRRLLPDFASVGQFNHVILQVPLPDDTLWLECTNPRLPLGYVHDDIAGHDAIEVSAAGGRMVRLPAYNDTTNLLRTNLHMDIADNGRAMMRLSQDARQWQYESYMPLLNMSDQNRSKVVQHMMRVPQTTVAQVSVQADGATILLEAEAESQRYASPNGQRLFVPVCPLHNGYTVPTASADRQEDIFIETGYLDTDDITINIPEGYAIETCPKGMTLEQPFGTFSFSIESEGQDIHVRNRLLMKSGTYPKELFPQLVAFIQSVSNAYAQKVVLRSAS